MNYSDLLLQCQFGNVRGVKRLLETSEDPVDIFWDENHLLKYAANFDKAEVLKVLIEYYEKHTLKLRTERSEDDEPDIEYESWLQSNEFLRAKAQLQIAIQGIIDSTDKLSEGVTNVLKEYILEEDDKGSQADLDDLPPPEFDEDGTDSHESAEDYHSDTSHVGTDVSLEPDVLGDSS